MRHLTFSVCVALCLASAPAFADPPATAAVYSAHPPTQLAPGKYLLRFRLTNVAGISAQSRRVRAVPVVIGLKGTQIGVGGKYGPQIVGTLSNGSLSISGPTPGGATLTMAGNGGGATGRFTMSQGTVAFGGDYVLDPVIAGVSIPGETLTGVGTTSGFTTMTPATAGWNPAPGTLSGGGTGPSGVAGFSSGVTVPGPKGAVNVSNLQAPGTGSAPGVANLGPNLNGTPVSGWFADGGDASPLTPVGPPKSNGSTGGTSGGGGGKPLSNFGDAKPDTSSSSGIVDTVTKWWNGLSIVGTPTPAKPDGGSTPSTSQGNPMDDGSHNAGTGGSTLSFGSLPGAGSDKGGRAGSSGGVNGANGGTLNRPSPGGDNPFDVSPADVLNASKLLNFASDPTPGIGH